MVNYPCHKGRELTTTYLSNIVKFGINVNGAVEKKEIQTTD